MTILWVSSLPGQVGVLLHFRLDTDDGNNVVAAMTYKLADDTEKVGWCFSDSASNLNDLLGSLSESSLGDEKIEEARYLAEVSVDRYQIQRLPSNYGRF